MKSFLKKISKKRGFTLTEVLIGISILTVAIVSATNLLVTIVQSNKNNVKTLQAYYYAQEGLEAFRNIRDTNWLHNQDWLDGDINQKIQKIWGSGFKKNVDPLKGNMYEIVTKNVFDNSPINESKVEDGIMKTYAPWEVISINSEIEAQENKINGFKRVLYVYSYDCAKGQIGADCSDYVRVVSKVFWKDGSEKEVNLNEIFTNWKGGAL